MRLISTLFAFLMICLVAPAGYADAKTPPDEYIDELPIGELATQILKLGPKNTFVLYEGRQQRCKLVTTGEKLPPLPRGGFDNRFPPAALVMCHYTKPAKISRFDADHITSVVESSGTFECEVRPDNSVVIMDKDLVNDPDWPLNQRVSDSITSLPETMTAVGLHTVLATEFRMEPWPERKEDKNAAIVLRRDEIKNDTLVRDLLIKWLRSLEGSHTRAQVLPRHVYKEDKTALGWSTMVWF